MKGYQKIGGYAALLEGVLFIIILAIFFLLLPALGLTDIRDLSNPTVMLPIISEWPIVSVVGLIDVPFASLLLLIVLAVNEKLMIQAPRVARVSKILGIFSPILVLIVGIIRFIGILVISDLFRQGLPGVDAGFITIYIVETGFDLSAMVVMGIWVLTVNWTALKFGGFPKRMAYTGLVVGVMHIFIIIPFLVVLADSIWFSWLGIVLLKDIKN
ncbi:MAG: hypothetical protein B6244_02045 [Candidatus Cloacimonetes bacterium 4572_55]|nr:MAG: hypothetical protein B6244_02045 [Candidatus Cloacimonetes bacterium 4572_55]